MKSFHFITAFIFIGLLYSCGQALEKHTRQQHQFKKGTFGYDLKFLKLKDNVIILSNGAAQVIVSAKYQGKVFTSTATGLEGNSFGWINYKALNSDSLASHINAYGGEDRMWLGPEGGQFSIFFKPGTQMNYENWQTPAGLDSEPWILLFQDSIEVSMKKALQLENFSGTRFCTSLNRKIKLLSANDLRNDLGINPDPALNWVGFESVNTLTNTGAEKWSKGKGALCIWVLGMLNPSDSGVVVIPYIIGKEKDLGPVVTTDYFGEIPSSRIKTDNGLLYFRVDGKYRSKLGLSEKRTTSLAGSYDVTKNVLTILQFSKPDESSGYINQLWKIQKEPFNGDVINAYNDGPLDDGTQLGPFYEMESSSPAAFLAPGESLSHTQQIFHFTGNEKLLDQISEKIFGVTTGEIKSIFFNKTKIGRIKTPRN